MKKAHLSDETLRFSGSARPYHRSGGLAKKSWDDWVDGPGGKPRGKVNFSKIIAIALGVLALGCVVVGLVIELR